MIRLVALLAAAVTLGVFGATLAHHLRALPADVARGVTLGGLSGFLAGLIWLGVGLTLLLQRPAARPERAFFGAAIGMSLALFLDAGGASTLGGGFALARDAAATAGGLLLAILATTITSPTPRFALVAALATPLAWFVLPRALAFTAPAVAALLITLRGRQAGRAFTTRQQATWLVAGLVALVAGAMTGAVLAPAGSAMEAAWARDLAALLSLAVPFTAALSLQKIRLLEADRIVTTLGVGTLLASGALVATVAVNDLLTPPAGRAPGVAHRNVRPAGDAHGRASARPDCGARARCPLPGTAALADGVAGGRNRRLHATLRRLCHAPRRTTRTRPARGRRGLASRHDGSTPGARRAGHAPNSRR
jgi:hypothetical protein